MSWIQILADVVYRAACLVALAIAPPFLDPEPEPPSKLLVSAAVSLVLLLAAAYGALRLRASRAGVAPALILVALIASVVCAAIFRGQRAPLGRGLLFVAVPLWAGLAVAAGAVAERRLGARARRVASLVVAGAGLLLLGGSASWLFSPEKMWARCLDGGDDQFAIDALTRDKLRAHDYQGALAALDRCLQANAKACACLTERAEVRTQVPGADRATLDQALADARAAVGICPNDRSARAEVAIVLALHGDGAEAEKEARDGLKDDDRSARMHYALALALDRQGHALEALGEAQRAVDLGAGHDAALLFGAIAITLGDLDGAKHALDPLTGDKSDAPALYDRALIADRLNDYNRAREGYLAALHADPTFANARYNLVVLTLRRGVMKEAQHHAKKFAETFPKDPRNADLERLIAAASTASTAAPAPAPAPAPTP